MGSAFLLDYHSMPYPYTCQIFNLSPICQCRGVENVFTSGELRAPKPQQQMAGDGERSKADLLVKPIG